MSSPTVRVGTFWKASKGRYYLQWRGELGRWKTQQTDITTRGRKGEIAAARLAEQKERELLEAVDGTVRSWAWFEEKYRADHLQHTSKDNAYKWDAVVNFVETAWAEKGIKRPLMLSDMRPLFLSDIEALIRSELSAGSVSSYMGTLRSGINWAASRELCDPLPRTPKPPGRARNELPAYVLIPITEDSLRKMKGVSRKVVGQHADSVNRYLDALWLSGCRMRDPLRIHPFKRDCHRPIAIDGNEPYFYWTAEQKSGVGGEHRITLDFAADVKRRIDELGNDSMLYVPRCETGEVADRTALSNLVATIGRTAEVEAEPGKTVTAKHFRSSFCQRWSERGMPIGLLQNMARHRTEATTQKYYVGNSRQRVRFDETRFS